MTISIIRLPNVPQLWDGCDVTVPEEEYHARLNRYLYEWRYRYESTVNTIIGLTSPLTTKGDVWGFSTVNARIPVGANGYVLTADSTQALGVKWAASSSGTTSPLTTKGDLWGFSTVDARLPVGTNNFVLTADSTQALGVKWAAATTYTLTTKDEGTSLSSTVTAIDFTGARVTASGAGATTTVNIPATLTTKGDLLGFSSVEARIPVGADGTVLTADSSATLGVSWKPDTASDRWSWVFGSGYDGAFTADGSAAMPGASGPVANVYTLTRTVSFTDLTVNSGVTIYVAGKGVVLVKDTLTLNGNIEANGVLGRANYAADFYGTQSTGGGLATAGGAQGQALGGNGGAAGLLAGGGGVGGGAAGGTATVPPANWGGIAWSYLLQAILSGCGRSVGGGGYGGGAAGGGGTGGGFPGGNGGGCVAVLARIIDSSSTGSITANGGNGTNAIAANGGGGGGGGGGRVWLVTTTTNWSSYISLTANGGTGGNPNGTGNFGANGSAGTVASLILA